MKYLLDTQIFLWAAMNSPKFTPPIRGILLKPDNSFYFSIASIWEIQIKQASAKARIVANPALIRNSLLANGYQELMIEAKHIYVLDSMPMIHKDPFDRILIAQAIQEKFTLLTADEVVAKYPGPIQLV